VFRILDKNRASIESASSFTAKVVQTDEEEFPSFWNTPFPETLPVTLPGHCLVWEKNFDTGIIDTIDTTLAFSIDEGVVKADQNQQKRTVPFSELKDENEQSYLLHQEERPSTICRCC